MKKKGSDPFYTLVAALVASAFQEALADSVQMTLKAAWTASPVAINGQRDEGGWSTVVPLRQPPLTVWATWDASALYLAFESKEDRLESLKANAKEKEEKKAGDDDVVEWFLADRVANVTYQCLVNIKGVTAEAKEGDYAWNPGLKAQVVQERLKRVWKGEVRMPWAGLNISEPSHAALWFLIRRRGPHAGTGAPSGWVRFLCEGKGDSDGRPAVSAQSFSEIEIRDQVAKLAENLDWSLKTFKEKYRRYPSDAVPWPVMMRALAVVNMEEFNEPNPEDPKLMISDGEKTFGEYGKTVYHKEFHETVLQTFGGNEKLIVPSRVAMMALENHIGRRNDGVYREIPESVQLLEKFVYRLKGEQYELIHLGVDGILDSEDDIRSHGSWARPFEDPLWFGVRVGRVPKGLEVRWVAKEGPASKAGIKAGDILTKLEDQPLTDPKRFADQIAGFARASRIKLGLLRNGHPIELAVTLGQ